MPNTTPFKKPLAKRTQPPPADSWWARPMTWAEFTAAQAQRATEANWGTGKTGPDA